MALLPPLQSHGTKTAQMKRARYESDDLHRARPPRKKKIVQNTAAVANGVLKEITFEREGTQCVCDDVYV